MAGMVTFYNLQCVELCRSRLRRRLQEPKESLQQGSAVSFTDNASTWEDLQQRVRQRQQELGWTPPDLENVRCSCCSLLASYLTVPERMSISRHYHHFTHCRSTRMQGPTNSRALNRTFGKSAGPQLKLYRYNRSIASSGMSSASPDQCFRQ